MKTELIQLWAIVLFAFLCCCIVGCSSEKPEYAAVDHQKEFTLTSTEVRHVQVLLNSNFPHDQHKALQYVEKFPELAEAWNERIKELQDKGTHPAVRKKAAAILTANIL